MLTNHPVCLKSVTMDQRSVQSTLSSISAKRKRHTLIAQLKACAQRKDLQTGSRLHAEMVQEGLLERDLFAGSVLISMYAKCGSLAKARQVFDNLSARNVVSWNALISGYAQHGHGKEALECFGRMQREGASPDAVTFVGILKACGSIGASEKGEEIHARLVKEGLLRRANVGHALVDMYAKCGLLSKAQEVFDMLPVRDVFSWNTLISGYSQHGYGEEALNCFGRMKFEGVSPDPVTFVSILKACSSMKATDKGQEIHAEIVKERLLEKDAFIGTALVDMYARCGLLAKAQTVFDKLPLRDVVSWNALITGYVQNGNMKGALNCFERMQRERASPNAVTYVCILKACASTNATDKGQEVHAQVASKGLLERNVLVGTAVVDMYAKCGMLAKAQEVFDKLPVRDVVAWSVLIAGYTQIGKTESVFYTFEKMIEEGMKPDLVTFSSLLNACSQAGLLDKGQVYFESMCKDYGISPTLEHYTCMIDLLCRTGLLDKAVTLVKEMPFSATFVIWFTLLAACQKWGNIELGEYAFEHAVDLDDKHPGPYIYMSDIYADAGRQEDADKIEALRVEKQAWKKPGHCCWTDSVGVVHMFSTGNRHSQHKQICMKLKELALKMEQKDYARHIHLVLSDVFDDTKKGELCGHNEILAIAFALINTLNELPIYVVKNMRTCDDCHSTVALVSMLEHRRILVKDSTCIHVFEDGKCACRNHW